MGILDWSKKHARKIIGAVTVSALSAFGISTRDYDKAVIVELTYYDKDFVNLNRVIEFDTNLELLNNNIIINLIKKIENEIKEILNIKIQILHDINKSDYNSVSGSFKNIFSRLNSLDKKFHELEKLFQKIKMNNEGKLNYEKIDDIEEIKKIKRDVLFIRTWADTEFKSFREKEKQN